MKQLNIESLNDVMFTARLHSAFREAGNRLTATFLSLLWSNAQQRHTTHSGGGASLQHAPAP